MLKFFYKILNPLFLYAVFVLSYWFFKISPVEVMVSTTAGGIVFLAFNVVYTKLMSQNLKDNLRHIEKKSHKHPSITGIQSFFRFNYFLIFVGLILGILYISFVYNLVGQQGLQLSPLSVVSYFLVLFATSIIAMMEGILKRDFATFGIGWARACGRSFFHLLNLVVFGLGLQVHFGIDNNLFLGIFLGFMVLQDSLIAIISSRLKRLKYTQNSPFWFNILFQDL